MKDMSQQFLYAQVIEKIEKLIDENNLSAGGKLPSVRKVSQQLDVSLTTVKQAYDILIGKGMIISKERSGYFVNTKHFDSKSNQKELFCTLSEKVNVNEVSTNMLINVRDFAVGNFAILAPVPEVLPINKVNKKVREALNDPNNFAFSYPLIDGHPLLIQQISRLTLGWQNTMSTNEILITNGCMEAINLCLEAVTKPGDIVIIESPSYLGILQSLERFGLQAYEIPTDKNLGGIDLLLLEEILKKTRVAACLLMPRMNNPLGNYMPDAQKIKLLDILHKHQTPLIEDDALGEITFENTQNSPAKSFDKYDNVMYCSSFSKTLSPGFRIGWVSGGKYQEKIKKIKYSINISTNSILQHAIASYLESGIYLSHLKKLNLSNQLNMMKYREAIAKYFPEECIVTMPKGGYSFWIELPVNIDGVELQRNALEKKIGICPGFFFSMNENLNHYIRLNYCTTFNFKIEQYLKTLGKLIGEKV